MKTIHSVKVLLSVLHLLISKVWYPPKITRFFTKLLKHYVQKCFVNYRVSRTETELYLKLMAKQIETELLTRVISVCPWMPAGEGCMPPTLSQLILYIC